MTSSVLGEFCILFSSTMWFRVRRRVVRRRRRTINPTQYLAHRERARELVTERLQHWNTIYGCTYHRVAIRNQVTRWGSCSSRGNLNFNYRILFLPQHLIDYIVVHELCHLIELNHSPAFWAQVARTVPDYASCVLELRTYTPRTLGKKEM